MIASRQQTLRSIAEIMKLPESEILGAMRSRPDLVAFAPPDALKPRHALSDAINFTLDEINRLNYGPPEASEIA